MFFPNIDDKDSIIKYINETHKQNNEANKNKYGEVFTPVILINELLDNLPKQLWKRPEYKWLDPCAGRGNFFLLVYFRLMEGLKEVFTNINERKKHILTKMLYMNELNKTNVKILEKIFGTNANITCLDFLKDWSDYKMYDKDNADRSIYSGIKYNVILENPPYQILKKETYKGGRGNNHTLWDRFIRKSFEILDEKNGWLGAITPANWRRPNHPLYTNIIAPRLTYLHIYGKKEGIRLFGAQTRFDLYILSKNDKTIANIDLSPPLHQPSQPPPLIIDEMGKTHCEIRPMEWAFLPNYSYEKVNRFFSLKKTFKRKTKKVIYDSNEYNSKTLLKRQTSTAKYPIVHTMTRKGLGIRWSLKKKKHFGTAKVLLNFNEILYPYNDWKGEYGMSQLTFGIPIKSKKEGDELIKTMNRDDFKEAIKATKWGSFQTDYKMFEYLD
jgi:hypothetical protein